METGMVLMGVSGPFEEWEVSANAITKESINYKCWITLINQWINWSGYIGCLMRYNRQVT